MDAELDQMIERSDEQPSQEGHSHAMDKENRRLRELIAELLRSNERLRQQLAQR